MPYRTIMQRSGVAVATATALVAFLVVNLVVSYESLQEIATSQAGVRRATENLNAIQAVFSALQDAETGQRGYLLTGDKHYLAPFESAVARLPDARAQLAKLLGDDPRQRQRLQELDSAIQDKLETAQAAINSRREQGFDAALALVRQPAGKHAMDRIREIIADLSQAEDNRRARLLAEAAECARRSIMLLSLSALLGAGVVAVGFYLIFREMASRLRLAEELKAADRNKNEFLALLGHELRNPLAAVSNAVDVMELLGPLPDAVDEMRAIIDRQSRTMSRLVDDLHDASRIAHGKLELQKSHLDLHELLDRAVADARSATQSSGVQIDLETPDSGPIWVWGDATRLNQVIANLIYNGVKFSPRGERVLVRLAAPRDGAVEFAVIDSGLGISRDAVKHIFEPFSQAHGARGNPRGGLGLGLALARGLVALHGGEIRADSAGRDRGATFTVRLPLASAPAASPEPCVEPPGTPGNCRIVIIDDRRDSSYPLQRMLELAGHEVHIATDGPCGIALALELHPDLVLCDIGLPGGISGYDVARELRRRTETASLLLVAITGYGGDDDRADAAAAGFDRHLTKPISLAMLQEILRLVPCTAQGQASVAKT
ncbi:MAG: CHASE3 domain-containing protein [Pirellulales bacterium]|nr:CHASE3 domain-containing protein [Pirellulales bacterium]